MDNQSNLKLPQKRKRKSKLLSIYMRASIFLEQIESTQLCLQSLDDSQNDQTNKEIYKLLLIAVQRKEETVYLMNKIGKSKIKFLNPKLARILIGEILWGKQFLPPITEGVETINYYEECFRDAFLEAMNAICNPLDRDSFKLPTYVRINTLVMTVDDALNAFQTEGWSLLQRSDSYSEYLKVLENLGSKNFMRDYHISELLVFPAGTMFYEHPGYLKGKFLIQDKGSCLSSFLLNPKPNSVVLDVTAAPGLKTNHIANIMSNSGLIFANDRHIERFEKLCDLLKLTGVTCAETSNFNYIDIPHEKEKIQYILIDPTCTYSGVFFLTSKSDNTDRLQQNKFYLSKMLKYVLYNYSNVKRVVFTTCSLYPEEGEQIVDEALKNLGELFTLLDVKQMLWNEWESVGLPEYICGEKCVRTIPEYDQCQGWFIAVFERNFYIPKT